MIEMPLLSVESLHKSFGRHAACRDVSFELWPGEVLGIVGESGSGKSTLLNAIAGIVVRPTSSLHAVLLTFSPQKFRYSTLGAPRLL